MGKDMVVKARNAIQARWPVAAVGLALTINGIWIVALAYWILMIV
jgi:hypothetical protein